MNGNANSSSGIETSIDYSGMFKKLITKVVDEKTIILEDFIRKNDLSPKEIVLENKEDIRSSTEAITDIIQSLITEVKVIGINSVNDSKLLDRTVREAKEKIVDKFEFIMSSSVNKELNSVKSVLDAFLVDLRKLDSLKELENLQNLDILKKLEALESLDKLQDLDKLKDLENIEKLQELDKLSKLDNVDFDQMLGLLKDVEDNTISLASHIIPDIDSKIDIVSDIVENLPQGYADILETIKANRDMIIDKILLSENNIISDINRIEGTITDYIADKVIESERRIIEEIEGKIQLLVLNSETRLMEKICENKFIEVFNKKELPEASIHPGKKAIVYGWISGSTLYKSDGKKWIKI